MESNWYLNLFFEIKFHPTESGLRLEPHPAPHPRVGAVDMVAFMPLSDASATDLAGQLESCDELATSLGKNLGERGLPVLLYGPRANRTLLEARRGTSFFRSVKAAEPRDVSLRLPPCFGPKAVLQRSGLAIVGAMTYVTNFNLRVEGATLDECRRAAGAVRAEFGVQVMALPYGPQGGGVEIGCNLQAAKRAACPAIESVIECVRGALPSEAVVAHSYVVGLTPDEAREAGERIFAERE